MTRAVRAAAAGAALAAMLVGSTVVYPPPAAAQTSTPLCAIQGAGSRSPLAGGSGSGVVTTHGIVAADFLGPAVAPSERGFFLQDDGPLGQGCDGNDATSDGLFVFARSAVAADLAERVEAGMAVTVTGSVSEYYGQTQIALANADAVTATGGASPGRRAPCAGRPPRASARRLPRRADRGGSRG